MLPDYQTLALSEPQAGILLITLDRARFANAINTQLGLDLKDLWNRLIDVPQSYRCCILSGSGDKAFCAGGDLKERNGMSDDEWATQHLIFERMYQAQIACPVPVIAAVNGAAYGGGTEIALACDFIYAADSARFALTEVTLGIMPGGCGTQTLPRRVGEARAKEIILTGTPFSAEEALQWGMVNRVVPLAKLLECTLETAGRIAANAPLSVRQAKHSIHYGLQMDINSALRFEIEAYNRLHVTQDRKEGVRAFNEKRKPIFSGR